MKNKMPVMIGALVLLFFSHIIGSVVDITSYIQESDTAGFFILVIIAVVVLGLLCIETKDPIKKTQYCKIIWVLAFLMVCCHVAMNSYPEEETTTTHHTYTTTHKTTTSKKNSTSTYHNYSTHSYSSSDYGVEDYDDPEDFYDDHETDFEDYDEAEEYWYDYN